MFYAESTFIRGKYPKRSWEARGKEDGVIIFPKFGAKILVFLRSARFLEKLSSDEAFLAIKLTSINILPTSELGSKQRLLGIWGVFVGNRLRKQISFGNFLTCFIRDYKVNNKSQKITVNIFEFGIRYENLGLRQYQTRSQIKC